VTAGPAQRAASLRSLCATLAGGWARAAGAELAQLADALAAAYPACEVGGRAATLAEACAGFQVEQPDAARLQALLRGARRLADLLESGPARGPVDPALLPASPATWRFVLAGVQDDGEQAHAALGALGFEVRRADSPAQVAAARSARTVLVAGAGWIADFPDLMAAETAAATAAGLAPPLLAALVGAADFRSQVRARQGGARLLLDAPLDVTRLVGELAGLAWMPRHAYRVLLVDDNGAVLALYGAVLRDAGFEVLSTDDPVAARDFIDEFAPDVCVLDVEMPACSGADLSAVLRRECRFASLPVIYVSAFDDLDHQLDALAAGGEQFLRKPVAAPLLVAAAMARARQFRLLAAAERARLHSRAKLDTLKLALESHAIVAITDDDGAIVHVNQQFCACSGYRREELIGRTHRLVKSGHHPPSFFGALWETIAAGRVWHGEIGNRHRDGSAYWLRTTVVPVPSAHGAGRQYIAISTDVTDMKRKQAEREREAALSELLRRALGEFVLHQDLEGASALLLDGVLRLTDSGYGVLGEVSRDDRGQPRMVPRAIAETARRSGGPAQTGIDLHRLAPLIEAVLRDGVDLVANDARADARLCPEGAAPLSSFLGLSVGPAADPLGVLALANRPAGFDPDTCALLRAALRTYGVMIEATRLRQVRCAVAADLAQAGAPLEAILAHAQMLLLDDRLDAEARAHARDIVTAGRALAAGGQGAGRSDAAPRQRVLVADDNPANRALLRMQLEALGIDVDLAVDGAAALEKWEGGGHALILADRHMPGMDGLQLASAIRAHERDSGAHVPIITISAAPLPDHIVPGQDGGADDFLLKPIDLHALRHMLARWLAPGAPGAARQAPAILDPSFLTLGLAGVDAGQARELVDLFTACARDDLLACRNAIGQSGARMLPQYMHKLKSSARMVGAARFVALAESVEARAPGGAALDAAMLDELEAALDEVESAAGALGRAGREAGAAPERHDAALPRAVLVVDDDPVARRQLAMMLAAIGVPQVRLVASAQEALALLAREDGIELVISDLNMPDQDGIELLRELAARACDQRLILVSGIDERTLGTAAELARAMGLRLCGTLGKPVRLAALDSLLRLPCAATAAPGAARAISAADLADGLRRDQFSVHFQPKVDAATLRPVGVEALARWQRDGEAVAPDLFIALAERHGLIAQLSEALLAKALVGAARLAERGFELHLSVNVSASWLSDLRLPEFILASTRAVGIAPAQVVLEVTETGLMSDALTALDVLARLRLKGYTLSIDDFGTGYSSMSQLRRIPFGELKLDRSFVHGATDKPASRAILASSIEMARKLGLTTVAEGVETRADLDLLRGLGCDQVQGWFVARAMPLEQLLNWLEARPVSCNGSGERT